MIGTIRQFAETLVEHGIRLDVSSTGGMHSDNRCRYCDATVNWTEPQESIKHQDGCAYVKAKAFLAGERESPDPEAKTTYTLIRYRPSWSTWKGCSCHGTSKHHDSDFEFQRGLTFDELVKTIAKYKSQVKEGEQEYEFNYFDDWGGPGADWDPNSYSGSWSNWYLNDTLEKGVNEQEPIIKQKREAEEKARREQQERDERMRSTLAAVEAKERRDREEYERLKTKFEKGAKP